MAAVRWFMARLMPGILIGLLLYTHPAGAAPEQASALAPPLLAGEYRWLRGNSPFGVEHFGYRLSARSTWHVTASIRRIGSYLGTQARMTLTSATLQPLTASLRTLQMTRRGGASANFLRDRVLVSAQVSGRSLQRTLPVSFPALVACHDLYSCFLPLVPHVLHENRRTFDAVFPLTSRVVPVEVTDHGLQSTPFLDGFVRGRLLFLDIDHDRGVNVWVSEDEGIPFKFLSPRDGTEAWLTGYAGRPGAPDLPPVPEGVREEPLSFAGPAGELRGVLCGPSVRAGRRSPAFVLISDLGAHDREGNPASTQALRPALLRRIAHTAAEAGILTLRYDERGVGESRGDFTTATLEDLTGDAEAALAHLSSREDVDPSRLGVLGHGEGALIASRLATRYALHSAILLSPYSRPYDAIMMDQLEREWDRARYDEERRERGRQSQLRFIDWVQNPPPGRTPAAYAPYLNKRRWLLQHIQSDPLGSALAIPGSVLVLHGSSDREVQIDNAHTLRGAFASAGKKDVEVIIIGGLDHNYMPIQDESNLAEYEDAGRRVSPLLAHELTRWFRGTFGGGRDER